MSTKWHRLSPANQTDLPPLLFKYHITPDGYELYMTDLTNVWSEHLPREDILKRADDSGTTIDPSEDAEQYRMLLQKIGDAFHHEKDTHVTLNQKLPGTDALRLTTSTKLPRPLGTLEWTLYLEKEPPSSLAQYMLIPLIQAEADWGSRQQNLIDQLKRKDWILGKLFDKLEAVGVDLTTIFPGVSGLRTGRKDTTLSQAAKHIRGAASFDEEAWLEEHKQSSSGSNLASNLLKELSSTSKAVTQPDLLHSPPENWWHGLSAASSTTTLPRREDVGLTEQPKPSRDGGLTDTASDTDTEDDEFERQETPPRLKRSKYPGEDITSARRSPAPEQEPAKPSPSPSPYKPPIRAKGLGKIGGSKPAPAQAARSSPSPDRKPPHISPADNDETDSGSDSDLDRGRPAPRKPAPQTQTTSPVKQHGRGLGRIGGQRKEEQKEDSPQTTPSQSQSPGNVDNDNSLVQPQNNPPVKRRGLGTIGGKKKEPPPSHTEPPESQQSNASSKASPSPPSPKPNPKPTGKKLGVIGGGGSKPSKSSTTSAAPSFSSSHPPTRAHRADAETDDEDEDEKHNPANEEAPEPQAAETFAIKSPSPDEPEPKHRPKSSEPRANEPPKEPETEEDKANRKREELKRQLEAKAKAPAKKKRKF